MAGEFVSTSEEITSICFVWAVKWPLFHGTRNNCGTDVCARDTVVVHVVAAYIGTDIQPFGDLVGNIDLKVYLGDVIGLDYAFLICEVSADIHLCLLVSACECDIGRMRHAESCNQIEPIRIWKSVIRIADMLDITCITGLESVLQVVIVNAFIIYLDPGRGICIAYSVAVVELGHSEVVVEFDFGFSVAALSGSDEDYAVGASRAVYGRRCGIFQDFY